MVDTRDVKPGACSWSLWMPDLDDSALSHCPIRMSHSVAHRLKLETMRRQPYEACGLLIAQKGRTPPVFRRFIPMANVRPSATTFAVRRTELARALERAAGGLAALYHSHPRRLALSPLDVRGMQRSSMPWVIGVLTTVRSRGAPETTLYLAAYARRGQRVFRYEVTTRR